ncbi:MAG: SUMF1/EgtB/PvdO family nonheme iron enzyme [Chloroflexi bacterium]|nr:SUMF1/EgtB/PvdO family nonheme iron enzyme [Chloroflexota bacterium]
MTPENTDMSNILDRENWVEIPEGEFITGLSEEQWRTLWLKTRDISGYVDKSADIREKMDAALAKILNGEVPEVEDLLLFKGTMPVPYSKVRQRTVYLPRFCIARFQITSRQYWQFERGTPAVDLPTFLTESEIYEGKVQSTRGIAQVRHEPAVELCRQLGARLPTALEWEKAGRGTDGRLYPWGDEWDETRGFFYYGQKYPPRPDGGDKRTIDAYPSGVSPYGVWGMCGGLPDLIQIEPRDRTYDLNGKTFSIRLMGTHPREREAALGFVDHILTLGGYSEWGVALRPVFDEFP